MFEYEGVRLQYDWRAKEKQYKGIITERDNKINELTSQVFILSTEIEKLKEENKQVKEELSATRNRFRNFRANVKGSK